MKIVVFEDYLFITNSKDVLSIHDYLASIIPYLPFLQQFIIKPLIQLDVFPHKHIPSLSRIIPTCNGHRIHLDPNKLHKRAVYVFLDVIILDHLYLIGALDEAVGDDALGKENGDDLWGLNILCAHHEDGEVILLDGLNGTVVMEPGYVADETGTDEDYVMFAE